MNIDITALALSWIADYGAPVLAVILFLAGLGIPAPATLLVIASGAFVRQEILNGWVALPLGYVSVVSGDALLYTVGYFASSRVEVRFGHTAAWKKARDLFARLGGIAIYISRLTAVAAPVVLVAGSSRYPFCRFLAYDALGELTWILLYGSLGYAFGSQWEIISDFASDFSGFVTGALALAIGVYLFVKLRRKPRKNADAQIFHL